MPKSKKQTSLLGFYKPKPKTLPAAVGFVDDVSSTSSASTSDVCQDHVHENDGRDALQGQCAMAMDVEVDVDEADITMIQSETKHILGMPFPNFPNFG